MLRFVILYSLIIHSPQLAIPCYSSIRNIKPTLLPASLTASGILNIFYLAILAVVYVCIFVVVYVVVYVVVILIFLNKMFRVLVTLTTFKSILLDLCGTHTYWNFSNLGNTLYSCLQPSLRNQVWQLSNKEILSTNYIVHHHQTTCMYVYMYDVFYYALCFLLTIQQWVNVGVPCLPWEPHKTKDVSVCGTHLCGIYMYGYMWSGYYICESYKTKLYLCGAHMNVQVWGYLPVVIFW